MKRSRILLLCVPVAVVLLLVGELIVHQQHASSVAVSPAPPAATESPERLATNSAPPLADAQLQKLLELDTADGHDQEIAPDIATVLGLTADKAAVPVRQLSVVNGAVEAVSFGVFKDARGGYVFAGRNATETYAFYVDEKLNLLAAAKRSPSDAPAVTIPALEARQTFREILSIWARLADSPPTPTQTTGGG